MAIAIASYSSNLINNPTTCPKPTGLAVGDLMVCQLVMLNNTDVATWGAGWTQINKTSRAGGSGIYSEIRYKVADSTDVAASNVDTCSGGFTIGGTSQAHLMRITGASLLPYVTSAGDSSTSTTPSYANTITPGTNYPDSFLMFFTANDTASGSVSGYAITTSDPGGWTEVYDETAGKYSSVAYAIRPETTATGNSSCTFTATTRNIGQIVALRSERTSTTIDTVIDTDSTTNLGAYISTVSDTVVDTDSTTNTHTKQWTNDTKNTTTWINDTKH